MGYVDVAGVGHTLPDGRVLFADVSFRVGEGAKIALIGPNGAGKPPLRRMVAGDLPVQSGGIARSGGLGVMRQFIGMVAAGSAGKRGSGEMSLNALALALGPRAVREAGERLAAAERALHRAESDQKTQLRYAHGLAAWGESGGYDAEVLFDTVAVAALDLPWEKVRDRPVATLSGGQQKRFALELLLRGSDEVLLLDEPDNFLDVPAKRWLEARLKESDKSVLYVSHDRELLAQTADRVVAVEGGSAWVHPGGFASWHEARRARRDRVAVLGANGTGKSHFLRLLALGGTDPDPSFVPLSAVAPVAASGSARLGARVRPGHFSQVHDRPDLVERTLVEILWRGDEHRAGMDRHEAMKVLGRYELAGQGDQRFGTLSGGQQARFLILLLELGGATLLLLDEPTDNLDLASAEALEDGLAGFAGTVVAVTHDRWFTRSFDRFVLFQGDGEVVETPAPVWDVR